MALTLPSLSDISLDNPNGTADGSQQGFSQLDQQAADDQSYADEQLAQAQASDSGNADPTQSEISAEQSADSAEQSFLRSRDAAWRARWGATDSQGKSVAAVAAEAAPKPLGLLGKFLKVLTIPMSASAGLARSAVGKGTGSVWDTVKQSVNQGQDYGDLLRDMGVKSKWVTIPVGLGLDVALDPTTYIPVGGELGMGTKITRGLAKAGVEGGIAGAKSGLLDMLAKVARIGAGAAPDVLLKGRQLAPETEAAAKGMADIAATVEEALLSKRAKNYLKASNAAEIANGEWLKLVHGASDVKSAVEAEVAKQANSIGNKVSQFAGNKVVDLVHAVGSWATGGKMTREAAEKLALYTPAKTAEKAYAESFTEDLAKRVAAEAEGHPTAAKVSFSVPQSFKEIGQHILEDAPMFSSKGVPFVDFDKYAHVASQVSLMPEYYKAAEKQGKAGLETLAAGFFGDLPKGQQMPKLLELKAEADVLSGKLKSKFSDETLSMLGNVLSADSKAMARVKGWADAKNYDRILEYSAALKTMRTEFEPYDKALASFLTSDVGGGFIKATSLLNGLFRSAVLGANFPAGFVNQAISNAAFMSMHGLKALTPETFRAYAKAIKMLKGGTLDATDYFSLDPAIRKAVMMHPASFEALTGLSARALVDAKGFVSETIAGMMKSSRGVRAVTPEQADLFRTQMGGAMRAGEETASRLSSMTADQIRKDVMVQGELKAFGMSPKDIAARLADNTLEPSLLRQDVMVGTMGKFVRDMTEKAALPNASAFDKLVAYYLTKPMRLFSAPDRLARLASFIRMTDEGVDMGELAKLSSRFKLQKGEFEAIKYKLAAAPNEIKGTGRFRIDPGKALRIAQEMHMDYSAMPGWVKMARSVPVFGAPFSSFLAGSYHIAANTALKNPQFFMNVEKTKKEIAGQPTPAERNALMTPYYSYLNSPDYARLGAVNGSPVYFGLSQMLPYYSMSLIDGPDRRYKSATGQAVSKIIDSDLPLLKDPMGQFIMDYMVLPMITREAIGRFGQDLWPKDSSTLVKALYMARGAAEPLVPKALAYTALPLGMATDLSPQATEAIPNYSWRALYNAVKGRDTHGFLPSGTPESWKKTALRMTSLLGIPVKTFNKDYSDNPTGAPVGE